MPLFPKIDRHCPFKSELSSMMNGNHCTMCKRDVTDLTAMNNAEKRAFLNSCSGETCVRYEIPVARKIATAAALGAASIALSGTAAAQDIAENSEPAKDASSLDDSVEEVPIDEMDMYVWVGGIRHPDKTELTQVEEPEQDAQNTALPELPIIYEDTPVRSAEQKDSDQPQS